MLVLAGGPFLSISPPVDPFTRPQEMGEVRMVAIRPPLVCDALSARRAGLAHARAGGRQGSPAAATQLPQISLRHGLGRCNSYAANHQGALAIIASGRS